MQTAASRRAFSALASKIHPQLPLSPRESQQLLTLLTSSFREHLDREHPGFATKEIGNGHGDIQGRNHIARKEPGVASAAHPASSYGSATQHIDSILSNPLFAVRPRRRGSESAAVDVLKDPLGWFVDEIAAGTADIPKAAMCLRLLQSSLDSRRPHVKKNKRPGTLIAQWIRSSGLDASKDFLATSYSAKDNTRFFLGTLVPLLLAEKNQSPLWYWLTQTPEQWVQNGVDTARIHNFRSHLLKVMVSSAESYSRDEALVIFLRAKQMAQTREHGLTHKEIQSAGASLVNRIIANPQAISSPAWYESFLQSTSDWLGNWSTVVQSMLWLYHPTKPSALPGLSFIQHPQGAASYVTSKKSRQQFLVQLCLGVARQLLEEEKFAEAQIAMNFTREHFADIVLSKIPSVPSAHHVTSHERTKQEKENLEMLDRLLPA